MWIVVGMVENKKTAAHMRNILENEGILVKLRNVAKRIQSSEDTYEVLVLESESSSAREILIEKGL